MSNGIIDYYYEEIHKEQYEPLDDEIVKALFAKYRRTGDITIRDTLITHNLRLVCNVVKKYKVAYNYDQDFIKDIFQAGNIGLIRAVDLFDPEKGYKFSTYAYHCIDTEIIRLIGNSDIMKISGDKKREIYRLSRAMGKLYQKLCREPSKEELAEFLEISVEELEKLYRIMLLLNSPSLNEKIGKGDQLPQDELGDLIPSYSSDPNNIVEMIMEKRRPEIVEILLNNSNLTEKERIIIDMYFGLNGNNSYTLKEIGSMLGISRERVRQIRNNALEKMKNCSNRNKFEAEYYISDDKTSFNNIVGMGFFTLSEDFGNSELVLNFFAKRFIGEILDTINLEKRLHQHFNNFEELEKKGINNYIIDLLNEFDTCLCNYVLSHSYLLEILRKKFFAIKKKWIYFDLRNRELKIDWIIYYIQDYVKKHEEDFRFPDCFIIGYIAENLDIPELKEYASNTDMEYMKTLNIKELNYLNIMLKTIRKIINNNVFEPPEEEQSSSKNSSKKKLK